MHTKLTIILLTIIFACTIMWAQSRKDEIIVAKFKNQSITLKEFETAYSKNVGGIDKAKKGTVDDYKIFLDLYVKYLMKLADAKERGLDKDPSILNELNEYKESIASSFLIEKKLIEPETRKLYERRKWEYRVSHIMLIPQKGKEDSTYKMAETVLQSIKKGIDFSILAKKYSQDRNSAKEGGDIYYTTAGSLPLSFENAVYSLKVGKVYPNIVNTKYGYHIIKITDKRKRVPEIRASHILISFTNKGKTDTSMAYNQVKMIFDSLKIGGNFSDLAKKYSNDTGSKDMGGDLGFFKRRAMVKSFDEAAFNLKKTGDLSGIVKTRYGYHIIKLTGKLSPSTYEEDKKELVQLFKKNRFEQAKEKLASQLKVKYKYKFEATNFVKLVKSADTLIVGQSNKSIDKLKDLTLFSFKGKTFSINDVLSTIKTKKEYINKKMTANFLAKAIDKISQDKVLEIESSRLEDLNPKFADIMKEYKKGILIFSLQQNEVWNKVKIDSVKFLEFFKNNRKRFMWPDKVDFSEIFSKKDSLIKHYSELIKKGENFDTLAAKYTERPGFKKKAGSWGLREAKYNNLTQKAFTLKNPGDISGLFKNYGGHSILRLNKKIPAHVKTFEEAKNEATSAYQEMQAHKLENEYLRKLDEKYKPINFPNKLSEAFK
ncbi:MAG: peptidylprolyl isomerase [Bacteroidetes bacterium]|nr:peptidylprolyl isomerase [Bacteroidota bacterium]